MPQSSSQPVPRANGIFYLKQRVPTDLAREIKGAMLFVPVANQVRRVTAGEKIVVSLQTTDSREAKRRHAEAEAALQTQFETFRQGPRKLSQKQIVALAGEFYRSEVKANESVDYSEEALEAAAKRKEDEEAAIQAAIDMALAEAAALGESETQARIRAEAALASLGDIIKNRALEDYLDPYLLAIEEGDDVTVEGQFIRHAEALEILYGADVDRFTVLNNVVLDAEDRTRLLKEVGKAARLVCDRIAQNEDGDYSRDVNLDRFPAFEHPSALATFTIETVFEDWKIYNQDKKAESTIRRYSPSIASLGHFMKGCDLRTVTADHIYTWAAHRRDVDKISPDTVNANDLIAAKTLFNYAMSLEFKTRKKLLDPLLKDNPTKGIQLDPLKKNKRREPTFRQSEITAILTLARTVVIDLLYPRASASRRWTPFLCAYSGARISEVCGLRKHDISQEGAIWAMEFPQTKNGRGRRIPLHDALIAEGFIEFWKTAPDGYLFIDDIPRKANLSRSQPTQRAGEIGAWIRNNIELDKVLQPNHGWRHTFLTNAERDDIAIPERIANVITGHSGVRRGQTADKYRHQPVAVLKRWLDKYPPYEIG